MCEGRLLNDDPDEETIIHIYHGYGTCPGVVRT